MKMLRLALMVLLLSTTSHAEDTGTRDEAVAMVHRVQEKVAKDGMEATFEAVTNQDASFKDKDLYPFIYNLEGLNVAHGANPKMVGKNWITTKDQDGNHLVQRMVQTVSSTDGYGWVDYKWPHPITHKIQAKSAYVERLGDGYFVGVGVYIK